MEIILEKPVRNLGKVGEIVKVKNGYGRNYLIPAGLAVRASKQNVEELAKKQKELEKRNTEAKALATKAAKAINAKQLTFIAQAAVDGKLFGSISKKDIAKKLGELTDFELNYSNILLDSAIKNIDVYDVEVTLHPEISANITVVVARAESEIQNMLSEYQDKKNNKGKKKEATKDDVAAAQGETKITATEKDKEVSEETAVKEDKTTKKAAAKKEDKKDKEDK
ncbi:MAG: 50S ribosomal protein L9 [Rickettsiaceae bacterium]|nr:50S ribosomal protein L9 [Rickettsiaceae bacterium]